MLGFLVIKALGTLVWVIFRGIISLFIRPRCGREFTDTYLGTRPGGAFSNEAARGLGCYWAFWILLALGGCALFILIGNYMVNHPSK